MNESEFTERAEATLKAIEDAIDATGADIEIARTGNVLTLEIGADARVVVNTQAPMRQIWVAARSGAHHFEWNGGVWRDTRDGSELFAALSRIASALGAPIVLRERPQKT